MKFLTTILFLLSSLSAFALPEDYYYDTPYVVSESEVVNVKVVEVLNPTSYNAQTVCKDLGYKRASSYSVSTNSRVSKLDTVRCVR